MPLTPEQLARVEENRRKALERLKQRGVLSGNNRVNKPAPIPSNSKSNIYSVSLSDEQRKKIEANRKKALQIVKEKQSNFRDASTNENSSFSTANNKSIRPSIRQHQYIDYDLSTMKDTNGGFIGSDGNRSSENGTEKSLDEWKAEQRIVRDLPPPVDMENAIKCYECGTFEINQKLWETFKCRVCRRCERNNPNKYSLLTKTECREDYFMTEPELQDLSILPRLEKPNPHGTYSRMQLFLRYQVEEFAYKKWGGPEGLDAEWVRREEGRVKRRDKKYENKMKEMRKKTRAEEYNRKIREGKFDDHVHSWSNYFDGGVDEDGSPLRKRRCLHCGFETEEIMI